MTQKHNPFHTNNETHCGDCDLLLTTKGRRGGEIIIDSGVRCETCYHSFKLSLGSPDPFDLENYEGN